MVAVNTISTINMNPVQQKAVQPAVKNVAPVQTAAVTNPFESGLKAQAMMNMVSVQKVEQKPEVAKAPYKNSLRTMFQNNEAKILAIIPRTFNAKDENGDEKISGKEQHGTLLNAIERLDEIQKQGFNTFHLLPIHETGERS